MFGDESAGPRGQVHERCLLHHVDNSRIEVGLLSWNARQPDCASHIPSPWYIELSQGPWHEDIHVVVRLVSQVFSLSISFCIPVLPARMF